MLLSYALRMVQPIPWDGRFSMLIEKECIFRSVLIMTVGDFEGQSWNNVSTVVPIKISVNWEDLSTFNGYLRIAGDGFGNI
jgi:hypothetical protein